jgi:coenzyme F420-reducing hydrogenase delta subunit
MCSGRVDPTFILKAFQAGADGVLVAGCHLGDCHYIDGNHKTIRRMALLKRLLEAYGIACTFSDPLVCALTLDKAIAQLRKNHAIARQVQVYDYRGWYPKEKPEEEA